MHAHVCLKPSTHILQAPSSIDLAFKSGAASPADGLKRISFDEIVNDRNATVRIADDGLLYAVDLAMVMTGKNQNDAAQAIRGLNSEMFHSDKFIDRKLSSRYRVFLIEVPISNFFLIEVPISDNALSLQGRPCNQAHHHPARPRACDGSPRQGCN